MKNLVWQQNRHQKVLYRGALKNLVWQQNCHQKVFYRGALQYI